MLRRPSASRYTALIARSCALQVSLARKASTRPKSTPSAFMNGGATPCSDCIQPAQRERIITHWIRNTAARVPKKATKARP